MKTLSVNQSVSQFFHGPTPRSPLHRLSIRLHRSRSTTSTEYSLPGATQLSQVQVTVSALSQRGPRRTGGRHSRGNVTNPNPNPNPNPNTCSLIYIIRVTAVQGMH